MRLFRSASVFSVLPPKRVQRVKAGATILIAHACYHDSIRLVACCLSNLMLRITCDHTP
jgi:hypothetical protein